MRSVRSEGQNQGSPVKISQQHSTTSCKMMVPRHLLNKSTKKQRKVEQSDPFTIFRVLTLRKELSGSAVSLRSAQGPHRSSSRTSLYTLRRVPGAPGALGTLCLIRSRLTHIDGHPSVRPHPHGRCMCCMASTSQK